MKQKLVQTLQVCLFFKMVSKLFEQESRLCSFQLYMGWAQPPAHHRKHTRRRRGPSNVILGQGPFPLIRLEAAHVGVMEPAAGCIAAAPRRTKTELSSGGCWRGCSPSPPAFDSWDRTRCFTGDFSQCSISAWMLPSVASNA